MIFSLEGQTKNVVHLDVKTVKTRNMRGENIELKMIQKLSDNKHKIIVECGVYNGKRKRKSTTIIGSEEEAKLLEETLLSEIKNKKSTSNGRGDHLNTNLKDKNINKRETNTKPNVNYDIETKGLTFRELADTYINDYCKVNLKNNTIYGYQTLLVTILKELGDLYVKDITPILLQRFYNKLKIEFGYCSNTIRHYYVLINSIFEKGVRWKLISYNPNQDVDKPKLEKPKAKVYNQEQVNKLMKALEKEPITYQVPIILCLDTGMRREELNGLMWKHVNFNTNEITIEQVRIAVGNKIIVETPKTEMSNRIVKVSNKSMQLLKELKTYQDNCKETLQNKWSDSGFVFVTEEGKPYYPDTLSKIFRKILIKHNLDVITFHQLRHTTATLLLHNQIEITSISARLGHSNVSTTLNIYSQPLEEVNNQMANTMDNLLSSY